MKKSSLVIVILLLNTIVFGQISSYNYKRNLSGITDEWHSIQLPNSIFEKIGSSFNDIRIYGITKKSDTVEAPYFISTKQDKIYVENVKFELMNSVKNNDGYFYTLKMKKGEVINSINLDFGVDNYDWNIRLEGSHDEQNWFTVVDDYRILSINTEFTRYSYNHVSFPKASYTYYRVFVPSSVEPQFITPKITMTKYVYGSMKNYTITSKNQFEDKKAKETVMKINLKHAVPLSEIQINSDAQFDYYRHVEIEYLYDSIKTKNGYKYQYETLASGTFSSLEKNVFSLRNKIAKQLRITIQNHDNKPLKISSVELKGQVYQLHARFTDPGDYILAYGNKDQRAPIYDIDHFRSSVPEDLKNLKLGTEIIIPKKVKSEEEIKEEAPLLNSKLWIWAIMGVVIIILGWFSFKMLRSEDSENKE